MAALNFNRINWFLLQQLFHRHGFLFLFMFSFTAAQPRSPSTPEPPMQFDPFTPTAKFNPSLAILMVIIVGAFFLMGFFSIYVRRCAERRFGGTILNPMVGVGRWSRRGQQGLDPAVINTFPTFLYSTVKGHKIGKDSLECAVCLNEFEDDETLRLIPKCSHVFHPDCIDAWLVSNTTCPVCRANLVPTPGDSSFDSTSLFEADDNLVEPQPDRRSNNMADEPQNNPELQQPPQSPNVVLINKANQNRPPRSRSTGWRFGNVFPRSHSTGHSLVQPGENLDRFTLRLPEEIRSQLLNTHLDRTKSCVTFTRAMSSRRGYRSRSSRNYYERFDRSGRGDRWGFTKSPPFIGRAGSIRSSNRGTGSDEVNNVSTPKTLLKSVKSPFDRLFLGVDGSSSNNENGERSSDKLRASALDSQV